MLPAYLLQAITKAAKRKAVNAVRDSSSVLQLERARQMIMADIGMTDSFLSGVYQSGLRWKGHSRSSTVVAVTPTDYVVFDGELSPDPGDIVGFIPRERLVDIRAEDRSTPDLNDHRLFLDYGQADGESLVAEFRFATHGSLRIAWDGWYRFAIRAG
ncbi:MAG: hypothetical protein WD004_00075 [Actinomycetota bacterium]